MRSNVINYEPVVLSEEEAQRLQARRDAAPIQYIPLDLDKVARLRKLRLKCQTNGKCKFKRTVVNGHVV
jgi:hypothetical protein